MDMSEALRTGEAGETLHGNAFCVARDQLTFSYWPATPSSVKDGAVAAVCFHLQAHFPDAGLSSRLPVPARQLLSLRAIIKSNTTV